MPQPRLLIIDDEPSYHLTLQALFHREYELRCAKEGAAGISEAEDWQPDLILLDVIMPGLDGFQVCLRLRRNEKTRHIPIIFLTGREDPESESLGLELGAEDFVTKPIHAEVLKSRVRRRLGIMSGGTAEGVVRLGDCQVSWDRQEVLHGEERIPLTPKETELLHLFVANPARILSRRRILDKIWMETYITDRTIDSHVKELRRKIPPLTTMLKTVYGSGYRLDL